MFKDENRHYSLRKLSVGLASVLIGISFASSINSSSVKADTVESGSNSIQTVVKGSDAAIKGSDAVVKTDAKSVPEGQNQTPEAAKKDSGAITQDIRQKAVKASKAVAKLQNNEVKNNSDAKNAADDSKAAVKDTAESTLKGTNLAAKQQNTAVQGSDAIGDKASKAKAEATKKAVAAAFRADSSETALNLNGTNAIDPETLKENKTEAVVKADPARGIDPVKFASNGGFDPTIWGTMDTSKWQLDNDGNITGYTGDMSHIIIPNASDFAKAGKSYSQIGISSYEMKKLGGNNDEANTLSISLTDNKKVKASDTLWSSTFNSTLLKQADLEGLDTSEVTNMYAMFSGAGNLTNLDVSNWDTSNVTNMSEMFEYTSGLTSLDVSNWNTGNVTNMSEMFEYASGLTNLDVSKWDTSNVTNMSEMFSGTSGLTRLDVSKWNTDKVIDMSGMFKGASSLASLDMYHWDVGNVTDMSWMFAGDTSLMFIGKQDWNTSKVTNMGYMFYGTSSLRFLDTGNWNTSHVTDMGHMFDGASTLDRLILNRWDTSNVTNMSAMFNGDSSLELLAVENWDTGKVTNMGYMFSGAICLNVIDGISKWNTSNVTNMGSMFKNASSLTNLDLSTWDTSNVTDMSGMFDGADKLVLIVNNKIASIGNNKIGWQHATDNGAFNVAPVVITNNPNILHVRNNSHYTIDGNSIPRSAIFDSADLRHLGDYVGRIPRYYTRMNPDEQKRYATDIVKLYNLQMMQDYENHHPDRKIEYRHDPKQYGYDPIALARAEFVTTTRVSAILDNPANYNKLHATATREYIIHNIDGSTTTITQSINYHRTGTHNFATNEDTFTEWIYSPDENSVVAVVTNDKNGTAIANPVTVEGDNCVERDGEAYFGSLKIKPKAGFKLVFDKPETAELNAQAKLASRLLPGQFFVLKAFAPIPHKTTKQIMSANSIKAKHDHTSASAETITSANAIKQGKDVIVKPVVKLIKPNEQATIHNQTHEGSPINGLANTESQLADVQNISMVNGKQAKSDVNNQDSMQVVNLSETVSTATPVAIEVAKPIKTEPKVTISATPKAIDLSNDVVAITPKETTWHVASESERDTYRVSNGKYTVELPHISNAQLHVIANDSTKDSVLFTYKGQSSKYAFKIKFVNGHYLLATYEIKSGKLVKVMDYNFVSSVKMADLIKNWLKL